MPVFFITLGIMHLGLVSPANPHLQINRKLKNSTYENNSLSIYLSHKQVFLYLFKSGGHKNIWKLSEAFKETKKTKEKIPSTYNCVSKVKKNKKHQNCFKLVILP